MLVSTEFSAEKALVSVMLTILLQQMGPKLTASCGYNIEWVPGARVKHQVIQCHSSRRPIKRHH